MKYFSSRNKKISFTFEEVLFSGYASDGGLFMPETIPLLTFHELSLWKTLSYASILEKIVQLFVSEEEISAAELNKIISKAFADFKTPEIIPIKHLKNGLNIAELFHGETLAFKDLAIKLVAQLMDCFLYKKKRHVIIVVGTSGDTGSSAIHGVRNMKWADIIVLYPKDSCSHLQELQMITVLNENVHCYAVEGSSDDLDIPIKQCLTDKTFAAAHNLCCMNSINWARVMAQIAHYFFVYFHLIESLGPTLEVIIPTGAAGNLTAGCFAKLMGLPITLVSCVNENKAVHDFFSEGYYKLSEKLYSTLAPAMDIQVAYNLERILYLMSEGDTIFVSNFFSKYEKEKKAILPLETKV